MTARELIKFLECCDLDKEVVILVTMMGEENPFVVFKEVGGTQEMDTTILIE